MPALKRLDALKPTVSDLLNVLHGQEKLSPAPCPPFWSHGQSHDGAINGIKPVLRQKNGGRSHAKHFLFRCQLNPHRRSMGWANNPTL